MAEPLQCHVLSSVTEDYLKAVWTSREWSTEPVTTKMLAERMGVAASTVSETVRRLTDQGLLEHRPYAAIDLTEHGQLHALAMVRRHRLLETYLMSELGYSWDEVHAEAEVLEHAVSDRLIERIADRLGHPGRDPHGDPIPGSDGPAQSPPVRRLSALEAGESGRVARISDEQADMLRWFTSIGLGLDVPVTVVERRAFAGVIRVAVGSSIELVDLGDVAAHAVWVSA
ncbi:MAG: metal-dependent transcriptional regulator [Actinomycetota bacterium]|nr:metal-dependent transcriptional regulator [Actinomycetota bacterium]